MRRAANSTLAHYDAHAALYADLFDEHDSEPARRRFLAALTPAQPAILDLGCGGGRDLAGFAAAGCAVTGLDGAARLAAEAMARTGQTVHVHDLLSPMPLPWPDGSFDGIWAHHLFFHLPGNALPFILDRVWQWLRPGGAFYACDPTGDGLEGVAPDGRYLAFRRPQQWKALMHNVGFNLIDEWRRPEGLPRRRQAWLATLWRRPVVDGDPQQDE